MDRSRELFIRGIAGGAGPEAARAALAGFALLVLGAAWYSTVAASPYPGTPILVGTHSPSSVIHDPLVSGVSLRPRELVLELVSGVLTAMQ